MADLGWTWGAQLARLPRQHSPESQMQRCLHPSFAGDEKQSLTLTREQPPPMRLQVHPWTGHRKLVGEWVVEQLTCWIWSSGDSRAQLGTAAALAGQTVPIWLGYETVSLLCQ